MLVIQLAVLCVRAFKCLCVFMYVSLLHLHSANKTRKFTEKISNSKTIHVQGKPENSRCSLTFPTVNRSIDLLELCKSPASIRIINL